MPKPTLPKLRFPSRFDSNIPAVIFSPQVYTASGPTDSKENVNAVTKPNDDIPVMALYMPGDFTENINAEWSEEELLQGSGGNWGAMLSSNLQQWFNKNMDSKLVNSVNAYAGTAPVPMDMLMFKSVSPMSVSFNFKMVPYDKEEGDNIIQICKNFKKNIMPHLASDANNIVLQFPTLWDISIVGMNGLGINPNPGYSLMALTSCSVNYTSGIESAAVYTDKNPVQVNLSLGFQHIKKHYTTG